jgi:putative effector of murein hydrolase
MNNSFILAGAVLALIVFPFVWIARRYRKTLLEPFLIILAIMTVSLMLAGIPLTGFLASVGGWLLIAALVWIAVALAVGIRFIMQLYHSR